MILINKALKIAYSGAKSEIVIGRGPQCDLHLNFPTVSKKHVRLLRENDSWIVEDQGSVNLTYINGEKITGRHALRPGDYLRLDIYTLVFFVKDPPQLPEISVQDPSTVIRHRLPLSQPSLFIGRKLLGNHIAIEDPRVSARHMALERQDRRWIVRPVKKDGLIKVNQVKIEETAPVNPGDKIQIGNTTLEISAPIVREWTAVTQVHTRLEDLYKTVRMQARTIEDAMHENFPAATGKFDWTKQVLDVFTLIDTRLRALQETANVLRSMVPSMETADADDAILAQAVRDSRRCANLANYLDLILRNDQLVQIQSSDLTRQRDLIRKLHQDVRGCLDKDEPTLLLK